MCTVLMMTDSRLKILERRVIIVCRGVSEKKSFDSILMTLNEVTAKRYINVWHHARNNGFQLGISFGMQSFATIAANEI